MGVDTSELMNAMMDNAMLVTCTTTYSTGVIDYRLIYGGEPRDEMQSLFDLQDEAKGE